MKTRIIQNGSKFTPEVQVVCYKRPEWRNFSCKNPFSAYGDKVLRFSSLNDAVKFLEIVVKSVPFTPERQKKKVCQTVFEREL